MFGSIKETDSKDHAGLGSVICNILRYNGLLHELESCAFFEWRPFDCKSCMMVSCICKIIKARGLCVTERQLDLFDLECGMHSYLQWSFPVSLTFHHDSLANMLLSELWLLPQQWIFKNNVYHWVIFQLGEQLFTTSFLNVEHSNYALGCSEGILDVS